MLIQILSHCSVCEISLRLFDQANRMSVELGLKIQILNLLMIDFLSQLIFMFIIFCCISIHLISSFLTFVITRLRFVQLFTFIIYPWRKGRCDFLNHSVFVLSFALNMQKALPVNTHIVELSIDQYDLAVGKTEGFAIHKAFYHL